MKLSRLRPPAVGFLAVLALFGGVQAFAQEAVTIAPRYEQDGKWFVRAATRFELDVTTEDPDGKRAVHSLVQTREDKYVREFSEVQGEVPVRQRITYMVSREAVTTDPTIPAEPVKTEIEDRAFTVTAKADGQEVLPEGAPVTDAALAMVQARERIFALLPNRPVAPGDTWNVEGADVGRFLVESASVQPDEDSSVICQFREVRAEGGANLAVISISLSLKGRSKPEAGGAGYEMQLQMVGELIFDLAQGKPRSLTLDGTLKTLGDKTGSLGETLLKVDGSGIVKYEIEIQ